MEYLPCFVIKVGNSSPKVYSLGDAHVVYNMAHYHHNKFLVLTGQTGSSNPDQFAPPVTQTGSSNPGWFAPPVTQTGSSNLDQFAPPVTQNGSSNLDQFAPPVTQNGSSNPGWFAPPVTQTGSSNPGWFAPPVTQTGQESVMIIVPHVQTNDVLDNIIAARGENSDSLLNSPMSESSSANPPVCYPYAGSPASSVDDSFDSLNYKKEMSGDVLKSIIPEKKRNYRRKLIDDIVFDSKADKGDNVEMRRLARDLHTAV